MARTWAPHPFLGVQVTAPGRAPTPDAPGLRHAAGAVPGRVERMSQLGPVATGPRWTDRRTGRRAGGTSRRAPPGMESGRGLRTAGQCPDGAGDLAVDDAVARRQRGCRG